MLSQLPVELLCEIIHSVDSVKDSNALARTCQHLHTIANPILYKRNVHQENSSALIWAAQKGQIGTARLLLNEGAPINKTNTYDENLLAIAAIHNQPAFMEFLIDEHDMSADGFGGSFHTSLQRAATAGCLESVKYLLAREDVNPNWQDLQGCTALFLAAMALHAEVVQFMLSHKRVQVIKGGRYTLTPIQAIFERQTHRITPMDADVSEAHKRTVKALLSSPKVQFDPYDSVMNNWRMKQGSEAIYEIFQSLGLDLYNDWDGKKWNVS
jgi:ankyrin repeat protein